ncbi:hypothetical protein [Reyranella sp.]|jgi:hypothetical protein|uniref:winged helix domain-containing protein n=1 Tax=Reyranella sp. TaxID=1929291 RepID=UPI0026081856|nr:hypothetical protein [Reyranella sp.]HQS18809.1 hypothetical protein [Reyranella sp.]HQT14882.1 hypothetical protein [Reyranella sp.]
MTTGRFALHAGEHGVQILELKGREEWALSHLLAAGSNGCTPIDTPGPRWSDYVFKLKKRGIVIETVTEAHGGPYRGTHARYVLRSKVERLSAPSPHGGASVDHQERHVAP